MEPTGHVVEITARAARDAENAYRWIRRTTPARAVSWFNGLVDAVESLTHNPERCGRAPEADTLGHDIRQLLYGKKHVYRVLFLVDRRRVVVLHIRHGARDALHEGDLKLP